MTVRSLEPLWPFVDTVDAKDGRFTFPRLKVGAAVEFVFEAPGLAPTKQLGIIATPGPHVFLPRSSAPEDEPTPTPKPVKTEDPLEKLDRERRAAHEPSVDTGSLSGAPRRLRELWTDADQVFTGKPRSGWWHFASYDLDRGGVGGSNHALWEFYLEFQDDGTIRVSDKDAPDGSSGTVDVWRDGTIKWHEFCGYRFKYIKADFRCQYYEFKAIDEERMIYKIGDTYIRQGVWVEE